MKTSHHLISLEKYTSLDNSSIDFDGSSWKIIWHVHLRNAARKFLWHMVKGILSLKDKLFKKGMNIDPACPFCFYEVKSGDHLFVRCNTTKKGWSAPPLGFHLPKNIDVRNWFSNWFKSKEQFGAQKVCVVLWKTWQGRNLFLFQQEPLNPLKITRRQE